MHELSPDKTLELVKSHVQIGEISEANDLLISKFNSIINESFPNIAVSEANSTNKDKIVCSSFEEAVDRVSFLFGTGKLSETVEFAQKLTSEYPDALEVWNILGATFAQLGNLEGAIEAFKKVIELKPNFAAAYNNIGIVFKEMGHLDDAVIAYQTAISHKPDYAVAFSNLSAVLIDQGKMEDAIEASESSLLIDSTHVPAYINLGLALKHQGQLSDAAVAYEKALFFDPEYELAYNNLGEIYSLQGKFEDALDLVNRALKINPNCVQAYSNLGNILRVLGKLEEAINACKTAIKIKPNYADAHHNLSYALLNSDRVAEGLDEYEWRWRLAKNVKSVRKFSQPVWDGQASLAGSRVLVWHEQGVGDTVNWSFYLPLLASKAKHCILECPSKLVPLFTRSFPNVEVKPENRSFDKVRTDFDYHIPIGSLCRQFLPEIERRECRDAYLIPDIDRVRFWRDRLKTLGSGPYIGIGWKSSNMKIERMPNYASIDEWAVLLKWEGLTFVNLQYSDFMPDIDKMRDELGIKVHNFDDLDLLDDIDDVAALCAALDHVVSTTSAIPYISAGVGTSTMLASWKQSAWSSHLFYPSGACVKKFHRNIWESWDHVFHQIHTEIKQSNADIVK
jgi:tetratricopeptide (TPR) repeat protein